MCYSLKEIKKTEKLFKNLKIKKLKINQHIMIKAVPGGKRN